MFQKTGSVTQKVPEVEEEGEKFEKKKMVSRNVRVERFFSTFVYFR